MSEAAQAEGLTEAKPPTLVLAPENLFSGLAARRGSIKKALKSSPAAPSKINAKSTLQTAAPLPHRIKKALSSTPGSADKINAVSTMLLSQRIPCYDLCIV